MKTIHFFHKFKDNKILYYQAKKIYNQIMKKQLSTFLTITLLVGSLTSCGDNYRKTCNLTFFDGANQLLSIQGLSGDKISDEHKSSIKTIEAKEDYYFAGWYEDEAFNKGVQVNYYPYRDTSLYAKFLKQVSITFNLNGGTFVNDSYSSSSSLVFKGVEGNPIDFEIPKAKKDQTSFLGWALEGSDEVSSFPTKYSSENLVFNAVYGDWPTLSFKLDGTKLEGKTLPELKIDPLKSIEESIPTNFFNEVSDILTNSPSKDYRFDGWYKYDASSDVKTDEVAYFDKSISSSLIVYPKFTNKVTVTYKVGDKTNLITPSKGYPNEAFEAPSLTEEFKTYINTNYQDKYFAGWTTTLDDKSTMYSFTSYPSSDLTLYAYFESNPVLEIYKADKTSLIQTINNKEVGENIDLMAFEHEYSLNEKEYITHFEIKKTIGANTSVSTIEIVDSKAIYTLLKEDLSATSIIIYPVVQTQYSYVVYDATISETTGQIVKGTNELASSLTKGKIEELDLSSNPNYNGENGLTSSYFVLNGVDLEMVSFPTSITSDSSFYIAYSRKVTYTIDKVYIDGVERIIDTDLVVGYQNQESSVKFIDKTQTDYILNGINGTKLTLTGISTSDYVISHFTSGSELVEFDMTSEGKLILDHSLTRTISIHFATKG